jgi:hypothetical protein
MSDHEITYEKAIKAFERERFFGEIGKSADPFTAGKWAGRIDATDWIMELLTPESWLEK